MAVLLAAALGLAPLPAAAGLHQYTEDFLSTQRCDTVRTTAAWDTVAATLHLHPQPLAQLGSYNTSGTAYAAVRLGQHLLVADGATNVLLSFDVADPAAPALRASLPLGGMARDVAVAGDWACVSQGSNWKLVTVDVSDPAAPSLGASVDLNGFAGGVAVGGGWAYVAQSNAGVAVVDVSDPLAPTVADTVRTGEWARDVALAGTVLLVADSGAGLTLLDVTTPAAPSFLGRLDTGGSCYGVTAVGGLAYVADGAGGLLIVDIGDPTAPSVVGSLELDGFAQHAAVAGDSVYVAGGAQGLYVVEAADPAQPRLAGQIASSGYAFQALPGPDAVWLCDGEGGVRSFRIDPDGVDTARNLAFSRDLHAGPEKILRAMLSADVDDTVSFALSADGGATWSPAAPDAWITFATPGTDLRWRATLIAGAASPPLCRRIDVQWETLDDYGAIVAVDDVPGDDGGLVRLRWSRSRHDAADGEHTVTSYSVYRRFAPGLKAPGAHPAAAYPPGSWEFLLTVPADREAEYAVTLPTLADSTAGDANWTVLFVRTRTAAAGVFFDSPPDSGYSVDNLAPDPPTGLVVDRQAPGGVLLTWDPYPDPDFAHFRVYRGTSPWTPPSPATLHAVTGGTSLLDQDAGLWYYLLTVVDLSGRESAPADAPSAAPPGTPALVLAPCAPNPANPRTATAFVLPPGGGVVRLAVYDVRGRRLATLADGYLTGGEHRAAWDGCDDGGRPAPSGRYYLRLESRGRRLVAPVTLVR